MNTQEQIAQYKDLQEMVQNSKGYRWILRHLDDEIKTDQRGFLDLSTNPEDDYKRFEKQVRLRLLNDLKDWADTEISRGRSAEMMQAAQQAKTASILNGTRR